MCVLYENERVEGDGGICAFVRLSFFGDCVWVYLRERAFMLCVCGAAPYSLALALALALAPSPLPLFQRRGREKECVRVREGDGESEREVGKGENARWTGEANSDDCT